jgi:hypothetical protein
MWMDKIHAFFIFFTAFYPSQLFEAGFFRRRQLPFSPCLFLSGFPEPAEQQADSRGEKASW